jgi:hypothetical protein
MVRAVENNKTSMMFDIRVDMTVITTELGRILFSWCSAGFKVLPNSIDVHT